jgi:FixJ family two-component response regulator
MPTKIRALLIYDEGGPLAALKPLLERLGIQTVRARSCAEMRGTLAYLEPPVLIFTDTAFPDGTWTDVEALAKQARPVAPVIVVSRFVDVPLYLDVLEHGASDFIVPPFIESDLVHVITGILLHSRTRVPSGIRQAKAENRTEVTNHVANHIGSRAAAFHPEA